ncbi:MAG: lamin tail domain-containing protein [Caldilineaceae bacterium]
MRLPADTVIAPGGYLTIDAETLLAAGVRLSLDGGVVALFEAPGDSLRLGYTQAMNYGPTAPDQAYGRVVTSNARVYTVPLATPSLGGANDNVKVGPIVISAIQYRPDGGYEYIELTNTGDQAVNLYDGVDSPAARPTAQSMPWQLDGVGYTLPVGLTLPPGASLRLVADDPLDLCMAAGGAPTRLVGPYPVRLSGRAQALALVTPLVRADGSAVPVEMDLVDYGTNAPWPVQAADSHTALERVDLTGFGSEPRNWRLRAVEETENAQAGTGTLSAGLCALRAAPDAGEAVVEWVIQSESNVSGYRVWRVGATPDEDVPVAQLIPATGTAEGSARYRAVDVTGSTGGHGLPAGSD